MKGITEIYKIRNDKLKEVNLFSYSDYLNSNEWREIKAKIKKRTALKWRVCNICGSSNNLNVHHSSYKVIGNKNPGNTLKMLCQSCHNELHQLSKENPTWSFYKTCGKLKSFRVKNGLFVFQPKKYYGN
jgi:5-methylcytosine-specific restriction endonuclease McrA